MSTKSELSPPCQGINGDLNDRRHDIDTETEGGILEAIAGRDPSPPSGGTSRHGSGESGLSRNSIPADKGPGPRGHPASGSPGLMSKVNLPHLPDRSGWILLFFRIRCACRFELVPARPRVLGHLH
ncbi:hypothetical protein AVEN_95758-1 [Araneus ventricosus]|uniref:Uncharacterized protein n=1 Tax=Araneus ventricosus TaxID=182803 RepID=A0A4Y2TMP9_ARAVE|nr:hypothetical protein AVEN_64597-1 [Araneus ventricosus]GBO02213.1 hypothetical protein AVEN_95758-1 [Araneus ventricosus]